jgi:RNase H-fold protein (predicted Holliday junction resolvase)
MVEKLYNILMKIDDTLPWIEMKGTYQTQKEAREAAQGFLNSVQIKVVEVSERNKTVKALTSLKSAH